MKDVERRPRDAGEDEAMPSPARQARQAKAPGAGQGGGGNRPSAAPAKANKRRTADEAAPRPDATTPAPRPRAARNGTAGGGTSRDAQGEAGAAPTLQKQALLDKLCAETSQPRAQVRALTDAVLAELGRALSCGEDLVLPPLGKVRVSRQRTGKGGEVIVMRLRRPGAGNPAAAGVAEPDGARDGD